VNDKEYIESTLKTIKEIVEQMKIGEKRAIEMMQSHKPPPK